MSQLQVKTTCLKGTCRYCLQLFCVHQSIDVKVEELYRTAALSSSLHYPVSHPLSTFKILSPFRCLSFIIFHIPNPPERRGMEHSWAGLLGLGSKSREHWLRICPGSRKLQLWQPPSINVSSQTPF